MTRLLLFAAAAFLAYAVWAWWAFRVTGHRHEWTDCDCAGDGYFYPGMAHMHCLTCQAIG